MPEYLAPTVFQRAATHLVPGIADRHRVMGAGGFEAVAEGAQVTLSNGRIALDFGSYAVPLFGHRPTSVLDAVRRSLDEMPTSTKILANPYTASLAARLADSVAPGRLTRACFGLNGSDAVECALKLAIASTGRPRLLAVERGFHGKSMGALAATWDPARREPVLGFLGPVHHLPLEPDAVRQAAREEPFAALIFEPVQGEGGGRRLEQDLLRRWTSDAHSAGAFVIADEIQCGLRRCGPVSVAVEAGLEPDAVLFGKALGGGVMPLSAALCTEELFAAFRRDPYFHTSTFGGHPASCAAGLATLDLLDEFDAEFKAKDGLLADGLAGLPQRYPGLVAEVHAYGLFGVIALTTPDLANLVMLEAGRRGLLMAPALSAPTVLRLLPPVVVSAEQMDHAFTILDTSLRVVRRRTTDRL
jgi:putrescine aminotransferase